jgi:hypothetical protein
VETIDVKAALIARRTFKAGSQPETFR